MSVRKRIPPYIRVSPASAICAFNLFASDGKNSSSTYTVTDETHVTIEAGENLSGNYVVQGEYLLILTRDEQRRPLA